MLEAEPHFEQRFSRCHFRTLTSLKKLGDNSGKFSRDGGLQRCANKCCFTTLGERDLEVVKSFSSVS